MLLLTIVLLLAAVPDQSLGEEDEDEEEEDDDSTIKGTDITPDDKKAIIDKHNEIRRDVKPSAANMLKMVWNDTIAASAKKWADECKLTISPTEDRTFSGMMCTENIFYTNIEGSWVNAIETWAKRKAYFKYGVGAVDASRSISSYTQLIWYNSYQTGCGLTICPGGTFFYFYVCQYCPAANREDLLPKPYKEGPWCQDCPNACEDKLCTNPCKRKDTTGNCEQLKALYSCKAKILKKHCKATCKCKTEII